MVCEDILASPQFGLGVTVCEKGLGRDYGCGQIQVPVVFFLKANSSVFMLTLRSNLELISQLVWIFVCTYHII